MEWIDFLNDQELHSNMEYRFAPDGNYLFGKILHDVLECLNAYNGWAGVVPQGEAELVVDMDNWFTKWIPIIKTWISELTLLWNHIGKLPGTSSEWPILIDQVEQIVSKVPELENELMAIAVTTSEQQNHIVKSIIRITLKLNLILCDIRAKEYKRLWTITQYESLLSDE